MLRAGRTKGAAPAAPAAGGGDDGFEEAGKGRRKGKKKAVDPNLLGFSVESSRIMQGEIQFAE